MKYLKVRKDLMFILNPFLFLSGILLFCFLPRVILSCFYAFWISTACALLLILSPLGKQHLAQNKDEIAQRMPWQQWFFCIAILELALFGAYLGICYINGHLFLINTTEHPGLFSTSLSAALLQDGLFPWPLYALIAVGMGMLAYRKHTHAYFSNLLRPFTKQEPQETWSLIINIGVKRFTLFALSTTLMFMTLLLISLFLPLKTHLAQGFQPSTLLVTLFLFFTVFSKNIKRYIHHIFSQRISTTMGFPIFTLALGLFILALSIIVTGLIQTNEQPTIPVIITEWIHYHWNFAWNIFSSIWWISFTPLISAFIIRLSKGYKIRDILIAVLVLPTVVALFLIFSQYIDSSTLTLSSLAIKLISLVSFLVLLPLLLNHSNAPNAIESFFPKQGIVKHRDRQLFYERITQFTGLAFYFYLTIGINGLSLFVFASTYSGVLTLITAPTAIVFSLLRKTPPTHL